MGSKVVRVTIGRIIFNRNIPQDLGFVRRVDENLSLIHIFVSQSAQRSILPFLRSKQSTLPSRTRTGETVPSSSL